MPSDSVVLQLLYSLSGSFSLCSLDMFVAALSDMVESSTNTAAFCLRSLQCAVIPQATWSCAHMTRCDAHVSDGNYAVLHR